MRNEVVVAAPASGRRAVARAGNRRLDGRANVDVRDGALEALPVGDGELDAALVVLALHYAPEPERVLREAGRALRPGGRVVVVDMLPHDREAYRAEMGHVWLGFSRETLGRLLETAGFEQVRITAMPSDAAAKGPALFAAGARRVVSSQ